MRWQKCVLFWNKWLVFDGGQESEWCCYCTCACVAAFQVICQKSKNVRHKVQDGTCWGTAYTSVKHQSTKIIACSFTRMLVGAVELQMLANADQLQSSSRCYRDCWKGRTLIGLYWRGTSNNAPLHHAVKPFPHAWKTPGCKHSSFSPSFSFLLSPWNDSHWETAASCFQDSFTWGIPVITFLCLSAALQETVYVLLIMKSYASKC